MTTKRQPAPKAARISAGLTREQVAVRAGISISTINQCEAHGRWPKQFRVLTAYRAALGLEPVK